MSCIASAVSSRIASGATWRKVRPPGLEGARRPRSSPAGTACRRGRSAAGRSSGTRARGTTDVLTSTRLVQPRLRPGRHGRRARTVRDPVAAADLRRRPPPGGRGAARGRRRGPASTSTSSTSGSRRRTPPRPTPTWCRSPSTCPALPEPRAGRSPARCCGAQTLPATATYESSLAIMGECVRRGRVAGAGGAHGVRADGRR